MKRYLRFKNGKIREYEAVSMAMTCRYKNQKDVAESAIITDLIFPGDIIRVVGGDGKRYICKVNSKRKVTINKASYFVSDIYPDIDEIYINNTLVAFVDDYVGWIVI